MMRRITLWAGLSLAMAVLTGCPPSYPNCKDDTTCTEHGEVCVQGTCQECSTDANCKEGFRCDGNKCAPKGPECSSDEQCGADRICQSGKCAASECKDDGQCGAGKCQRGRCVQPTNTCSADDDCPSGQRCESGRCSAGSRCEWTPIRFGFNDANISSDAQSRL